MEILLPFLAFLIMFLIVAVSGSYRGKSLANKVILLLDEKINEWENRGLNKEELKKHVENCIIRIDVIKISDYTEKEFLDRCRCILEDEEEVIPFDKK